MDKLGDIIVPLIIFAVVVVNFILKIAKAANKPPQQPVRRQIPPPVPPSRTTTAHDDWEDLLEALGKGKNNPDDFSPEHVEPALPKKSYNFPQAKPVAPPLPPVIVRSEPEPEFVRVSDYSSRPLDQIDEREFEVQRNITEKFADKESNIATVVVPTTTADHRTVHPILTRFRNRQSIREAIVMSEILGSPLALRD